MEALETNAAAEQENPRNSIASDEESRVIELVGFLVQGIVEHPNAVEVEEFYDSAGIVYGVRIHPDDAGRVIGREGRVASALRNLAKASATKIGAHVTVEILADDDDAPHHD